MKVTIIAAALLAISAGTASAQTTIQPLGGGRYMVDGSMVHVRPNGSGVTIWGLPQSQPPQPTLGAGIDWSIPLRVQPGPMYPTYPPQYR